MRDFMFFGMVFEVLILMLMNFGFIGKLVIFLVVGGRFLEGLEMCFINMFVVVI